MVYYGVATGSASYTLNGVTTTGTASATATSDISQAAANDAARQLADNLAYTNAMSDFNIINQTLDIIDGITGGTGSTGLRTGSFINVSIGPTADSQGTISYNGVFQTGNAGLDCGDGTITAHNFIGDTGSLVRSTNLEATYLGVVDNMYISTGFTAGNPPSFVHNSLNAGGLASKAVLYYGLNNGPGYNSYSSAGNLVFSSLSDNNDVNPTIVLNNSVKGVAMSVPNDNTLQVPNLNIDYGNLICEPGTTATSTDSDNFPQIKYVNNSFNQYGIQTNSALIYGSEQNPAYYLSAARIVNNGYGGELSIQCMGDTADVATISLSNPHNNNFCSITAAGPNILNTSGDFKVSGTITITPNVGGTATGQVYNSMSAPIYTGGIYSICCNAGTTNLNNSGNFCVVTSPGATANIDFGTSGIQIASGNYTNFQFTVPFYPYDGYQLNTITPFINAYTSSVPTVTIINPIVSTVGTNAVVTFSLYNAANQTTAYVTNISLLLLANQTFMQY